jgi:hypothetical protein
MGKVHRKGTAPDTKKLKRRAKRPCRSAPAVPGTVTVAFAKREVTNREIWRGRVRWDAVTQDTAGRALAVELYQVELRATDASGVPVDFDGGDPAVYSAPIPADLPRLAVFFPLARPRTWYYQGRVRALNRVRGARCWSAWSAWTTATQPATGALPGPAAPTGPTLTIDKVEGARSSPFRAKLSWNEVPQWAPADGDTVDGASRYDVQFAVSKDGGGSTINTRRRTVAARDEDADVTAYAEFTKIRRKRHYRGRIRAVDLFGRKGAWSAWTAWTQPGGKPGPVQNITVANPKPRKVVVRWDPPVDTTDFDYYKVEIYRGAVLMETGEIAGRQYVYDVPLADRGLTHTAKVYAVDAPESGAEEPSDPTTSGGIADAGVWTGDEVTTAQGPITDGVAPASSPTPTVRGLLKGLEVSWTPIVNADPVTYEVHVSATSGFTPSATTKVGEVGGDGFGFHIRKLNDGSDLVYGTTYFVKLIAKDEDGAAAPSAQASGTQLQVNTPDIVVNSITTALLAIEDYVDFLATSSPAAPAAGAVRVHGENLGGVAHLWAKLSTGIKLNLTVPSVQIARATPQSIANNTTTTVGITSETWDHGGFYPGSGDVLTIPFTGIYLLHAECLWAQDATGRRVLRINDGNLVLTPREDGRPAVSGGPTGQSFSCFSHLTNTDTVSLKVIQQSGGALDLDWAVLTMFLVRAI